MGLSLLYCVPHNFFTNHSLRILPFLNFFSLIFCLFHFPLELFKSLSQALDIVPDDTVSHGKVNFLTNFSII